MNHHTLALISEEAYRFAAFSIGECEAIVKYFDDCQVVAFRGTEAGSLFESAGWMDVVRDARVIPWYDRDCGWCHAGFLQGGLQAAEFLAERLADDVPMILTGHSLGGALALICARKLQAAGFHIAEWVGFGSPKVQFFGDKYPFLQTVYRYRSDIVPLLPRFPGYRHHGYVRRLLDCSRRPPNWTDHGMQHYVAETN